MAYQMAATAVSLSDLEGHSPVAGFFKCNPSNIYGAFYTFSTNSVLAQFLCISRAFFQRQIAHCNYWSYCGIVMRTVVMIPETHRTQLFPSCRRRPT